MARTPSVLALLVASSWCALAASAGERGGNNPPSNPVITEPAEDGRVLNPEDVHMETGPFADADPGDDHACTDWEIWAVMPPERVWSAMCASGLSKVHIHLGDGAFEGSHAGRTSLLPSGSYMLRSRHKDSSGVPSTEWSGYTERTFVTGQLASVFPMELDDIADSPAPTWVDATGEAVVLPGGGSPGALRIESGAGEAMLVITGGEGGGNLITNPPAIPHHVAARIRLAAGGTALVLPETDLRFTDHTGVDHEVFLPPVNVAAGESAYFWVASNGGTYTGQASQTEPDFSALARGASVPWTVLQPGYKVEVVASGFQLPVNIAFVPNPGLAPDSPLFYVTELYGTIKVVRRNGTVGDYATNLINFVPTGDFPGSGEQGVAGIAVDPVSGDVFAGMLYDAAPPNGPHYPKVVRFHSNDGGQTAATQTTILNMVGETQGQSHQISNITIGPDGKLYVHMGDGFNAATAQNLDSYRGKILRMNLSGTAPSDNPFYNAGNGINSRDYVFAYGMRNPFGGAWREADGRHYEVENGPSVDRIVRVNSGQNYLWSGSDASMRNFALYNWDPSSGPVNMAFIQPGTFGGSGFPAPKMGHGFVSESGSTWGTGPQNIGKRISEFVFDAAGEVVSGPTPLIRYNGSGKATVVGLAAGPDGLYFTDLYKDQGFVSPIDRGANVLRVRFVGSADFAAEPAAGMAPLAVQFTDLSTVPSPSAWLWSFGDGTTSTEANPTHVYEQDGFYDVRLTVTGSAGAGVLQKNAYVKVGQVARVALIGGSMPHGASDHEVEHFLSDMGFIVEAFDDEAENRPSAESLAEDFDLVIVSSTVTGGNIAGQFRDVDVPLIFWEQSLLTSAREGLATSGSVVAGVTTLNVVSPGHPVVQGVPGGIVNAFQPGANMSVGHGAFAPGASVVAVRAGSTDAAIIAAERGAARLGGTTTPARRVFLFFEDASFLSATAAAEQLLARAVCWSGGFDPVVDAPPDAAIATEGETAMFSVDASGAGPVVYRWRRDGVELASGGRISGAFTGTLTITDLQPGDAGAYDVVVSNPCGSVTSAGASLTVAALPECAVDWNDDGAVNSSDISAFLTAWLASVVAGDQGADFNGDMTTNSSDISAFLSAWLVGVSGGC